MLNDVYRMQRLFNNQVIGFDILAIEKEEDRIRWMRNYLTAYDQELKELLESLDLRCAMEVRRAAGALDIRNIKVEIIDMLHFLVSMFQVIGEKEIDAGSLADRPTELQACFDGLKQAFEREHGRPLDAGTDGEQNGALVFVAGRNLVSLGSLLDCLAWKWWARQSVAWDRVRGILYGEIFPQWCMLAVASGMSAAEAGDLYIRKNRLNFERQEKGYKEGTYRKVDEEGREDNEKLFEEAAAKKPAPRRSRGKSLRRT